MTDDKQQMFLFGLSLLKTVMKDEVKQEIIDGLKRLKDEALEADTFIPYQGEFAKDVEILTRAIEIIDKCIPVLKCKGAAPKGIEEDSTCDGCFNQRSCWCDDCNDYSNLNAK